MTSVAMIGRFSKIYLGEVTVLKILELRSIPVNGKASVQFIRIDPEDISVTLSEILKAIMDLSWLKNFDAESLARSYEQRAQITIADTDMKEVNDLFSKLYQQYLGRKLCQAEKSVLSTAVKIMIWKIYGKTFHRICQYRYAYASRTAERQQLYRKGNAEEANSIPAKYIVGYHDIPDKDLTAYPLISTSISAKDVDYDLIVYDTYDYLDKLIGFKLSDIFYAIFYQYYETTNDERALRLAKYFKYGTDKEREIWMLRYGFSFEEIEWVSECIDSIDETEIKFNDKLNALDEAQLKAVEQYVHK